MTVASGWPKTPYAIEARGFGRPVMNELGSIWCHFSDDRRSQPAVVIPPEEYFIADAYALMGASV